MRKQKIFLIIFIIIVTCFLLFWIGSILRCEVLTSQHKEEFATLYKLTNMIGSVDYLKVMDYSDSKARVYYVTKKDSGNLITFVKQKGQWKLKKWATIWSHYGSADGFVWPYFR